MSVNHDKFRKDKTGIPEVILAGPKLENDLKKSIKIALRAVETVLVTRIEKNQVTLIKHLAQEEKKECEFGRYKRTCIIGPNTNLKPMKCRIAILSGGTSDGPIVEEIRMTLKFFNHRAEIAEDVGVAGIHRHQRVLKTIEGRTEIKMLIVVAGSEGALFSVLSAQTKIPVIAVPTSTGYGFGGKGIAALQSALQSCSPGVVVVNIDNGFGAASFAIKVLNQFK